MALRANAHCKGCGRPILFALDESGKRQVLDLSAPVFLPILPEGRPSEEPPRWARVREAAVSHFSTCSHANEFSQRPLHAARKESRP
jgi:hypothetical protein